MFARFSKTVVRLICLSLLLPVQFNSAAAQSKAKSPPRKVPGKTAAGTLLPNGWTLTPEGAQVSTSDLPLNMVLSNDGHYLLVTTNGNGDQTINVIDLRRGESAQTTTRRTALTTSTPTARSPSSPALTPSGVTSIRRCTRLPECCARWS